MWILAAAAAAALAGWVYLLAGHGAYWRTGERLPPRRGQAHRYPSVIAVIPARDEAAVLPFTLPTLFAQDYPGSFSVVLVDDRSSDDTASIAAALAQAAGRPLRVVSGQPAPSGWAGKVWAMEQGVQAAGPSEYLLFTDADIAYRPGTLTALADGAVGGGYDLVSQMALLRAKTRWERLLVPAFVYFFAQLYPFRRVNRPAGRTAAAAGGCMLVRRQVLADAGGLQSIRSALIDDVALGRLVKHRPGGGRCWLGFSSLVASVRPYPRLGDLWAMVARSAYHQLRYSPVLLGGTVVGLVWMYLLPPAAAVAGVFAAATGNGPAAAWGAAAGLSGWAIMATTYLPVLRLYRLSPLRSATLPLIAMMYAAMTLDSAHRHRAGRGGEWKGRTATHPGISAGSSQQSAGQRASAGGSSQSADQRSGSELMP